MQANLQSLLDALTENAAVLAEDGTILLTNKGWRRAARQGGYTTLTIGGNFIEVSKEHASGGNRESIRILERLADISAGRRDRNELIVRGNGPDGDHRYKMQISRVSFGDSSYTLVCARDVTEHYEFMRMRRSLGSKLLLAQSRERRLIARELHDSAGQELTALQLALRRLKRISPGEESGRALADCDEALKRVNRDIRTLTFMNHPPALEDRGLAQAIEYLGTGFGARTGLNVDVDVRLDPALNVGEAKAIVLYRLAQEALSNIYRHADARNVTLRLIHAGRRLQLIVQDDGNGIGGGDGKSPVTPGVGIPGMEERLRDIGGRLTIKRLEPGTALCASVPYRRHDGTTSNLATQGQGACANDLLTFRARSGT